MKEENIKELQHLIYRREDLMKKIKGLKCVLEVGKENTGFNIIDSRQSQDYAGLWYLKDEYGFMNEALQKIYARYRQDLADVQKLIDEF